MTRKPLGDLFNMPKTATPVSRINGLRRKLFGTWSGIGANFQRLILHLRLWQWTAVHGRRFHYFEISFTKVIQLQIYRIPYGSEFLSITITLRKPQFYYMYSEADVLRFCRINNISQDLFDKDFDFETPF